MRKLDRYLLLEFLAPFGFGLGVFFLLLVGVDLLYDAIRLVVREGVPAGLVVRIVGYRLPTAALLTVPMASVFGALLCTSRLSSSGELTAMRAGGASVLRIALPVLIFGGLLSALLTALVHSWLPHCNSRARRLLSEYRSGAAGQQKVMLRIPERGPLERLVYVDHLDLARGLIENLVIHEFRHGQPWATLVARRARWGPQGWTLEQVEQSQILPGGGIRSCRLAELRYDLGRSPEDLQRVNYRPDELTTAELRRELQVVSRGPLPDPGHAAELRTELALRWARPWAVLGFAMAGLALGLRPQRTSHGIALSVSLAVILFYYVLLQTLTVLAEQGRLPALLCAWAANGGLFGIGVVGLLRHDLWPWGFKAP
jgi:lipopolysaccharide export system permease protein